MWDVPNYTASSELVGKFGRLGLVWFGLVWFGLVWFGLVWFGLVRFWFGLVDHYESATLIPALRTLSKYNQV